MGRVNRRIGKSSETANTTPDGTGGVKDNSYVDLKKNWPANTDTLLTCGVPFHRNGRRMQIRIQSVLPSGLDGRN